VQETQC